MDCVIAIDIGGTKIDMAGVDVEKLRLVDSSSAVLQGHEQLDNGSFFEFLAERINELMVALRQRGYQAVMMGVAAPGPLDHRLGVIEDPPNLAVRRMAIVAMLKRQYPEMFGIYLLNDADAMALGEYRLNYQERDHMTLLTLGTGVGCGHVEYGRLFRGRGKASEFGHTSVSIPGTMRECACGGINCAESFLGSSGLARTYCEVFEIKWELLSTRDRVSLSHLVPKDLRWLMPEPEDKRWTEVFDRYFLHLRLVLRNLACVYNPELIVFNGGIVRGFSYLQVRLDQLRNGLADMAANDPFMRLLDGTQLTVSSEEHPALFGAAWYAYRRNEAERATHEQFPA